MDIKKELNHTLYWLLFGGFLCLAAMVVAGTALPAFGPPVSTVAMIGAFVVGVLAFLYPLVSGARARRFYLPLILLIAGIVLVASEGGIRSWDLEQALILFLLLCITAGIALIWAVITMLRK